MKKSVLKNEKRNFHDIWKSCQYHVVYYSPLVWKWCFPCMDKRLCSVSDLFIFKGTKKVKVLISFSDLIALISAVKWLFFFQSDFCLCCDGSVLSWVWSSTANHLFFCFWTKKKNFCILTKKWKKKCFLNRKLYRTVLVESKTENITNNRRLSRKKKEKKKNMWIIISMWSSRVNWIT